MTTTTDTPIKPREFRGSLRNALARRGITAADLSRASGISEAELSRIKRGMRPTKDQARRLADVLEPPTDGPVET
jgi:transcriptional regulator with XRE-family HTH domain